MAEESNTPLEESTDPADRLDLHQKRYRHSPKGKATEQRYKSSDKGQEAVARYRDTENWYLVGKKYRMSEKGKAALARYQKKVDEFKTMVARIEAGDCVLCGATSKKRKILTTERYPMCRTCKTKRDKAGAKR